MRRKMMSTQSKQVTDRRSARGRIVRRRRRTRVMKRANSLLNTKKNQKQGMVLIMEVIMACHLKSLHSSKSSMSKRKNSKIEYDLAYPILIQAKTKE
jgi:hypothetical protein